jgi:hydrogenase nickel incorporation protein HypA/HybF
MHELAITEDIVATVTERTGEAKVTCVRLEIGALSGVVADSVRFCFDLVAQGTPLEGATLEISEPPASCRCRSCGGEFTPDGPFVLCPCGSADAEIVSGQNLKIVAVRVS